MDTVFKFGNVCADVTNQIYCQHSGNGTFVTAKNFQVFADVGMIMLGVASVSHFAELDFCENALTILLMKSHRKELDVFGLQTYL